MVKASKFLVLFGGLIGLVAFFLPFLTVKAEGQEVSVSAFQAVRGIAVVEDAVEEASGAGAMDTAEGQKARAEMDDLLSQVKGFLYGVYAPALLLVLLGVFGVLKRRFGRLAGVFSFLLGGATLGVWALLSMAAKEAGADASGAEASLGLGVQMLLFTGAGGALGGLVALVKPDRD